MCFDDIDLFCKTNTLLRFFHIICVLKTWLEKLWHYVTMMKTAEKTFCHSAATLWGQQSPTWVFLTSSVRPNWTRVSTAAQITSRDKVKVFSQDIRSSGDRQADRQAEPQRERQSDYDSLLLYILPSLRTFVTYQLSCLWYLHLNVWRCLPSHTGCDSRLSQVNP